MYLLINYYAALPANPYFLNGLRYAPLDGEIYIVDLDEAAGWRDLVDLAHQQTTEGGVARFGNDTYVRDVVCLNCCFYANGPGNYQDAISASEFPWKFTASEIDAACGGESNIVANPGFARLADNWDFSALYAGSPCLDEGIAGSDIGRYENPSTVPTSSQTYYVKPGGVSRELLEEVVIVVVPTQRFTAFARQLGITAAGGYRTISAYDLSALDEKSQPTCRSGFV